MWRHTRQRSHNRLDEQHRDALKQGSLETRQQLLARMIVDSVQLLMKCQAYIIVETLQEV